jgi:putative DNA primase/helicase
MIDDDEVRRLMGDDVSLDAAYAALNDRRSKPTKRGKPEQGNGAQPPEFSDDALALRFASEHANELRYVADWSKWLRWDRMRWQLDRTLAVFDNARVICRTAAAECNKMKLAKELAAGKSVAAVERLARCDRRLAATGDQWDADPWLLNTPAGVVDLHTGAIRPHRPEDYMTKITAAGPDGTSQLWLSFLDRITAGNTELQTFLQRMCGYALTGSTREHALFFGHGAGANGKTVFTDTVSNILADYHCTAPIETFTASSVDRHPTELADLRGARLVTAVETEDGRRWAESRIKMLTGGEKVKARFMRQDLFEFTPQLKLLITGNHRPGLRSVDEAMRRRFNLIPFTVTIPPEERDPDLTRKLKAEWPGILAWMVEGCLTWQRDGLHPPEIVKAATAAYLEGEDALTAWIEECCETDRLAWTRVSDLYASWKAWADKSGEYAGSTKRFVQTLEGHGYEQRRTHTGRGYMGLRLVPQEPAGQWWNR